MRYPLASSAGDSGYDHYAGDDLTVSSGDVFEIRVFYQGEVATAKTIVREPPENLSASTGQIFISESMPFGSSQDDSTNSINLTWKVDSTALFYVVVENLEESPVAISTLGGVVLPAGRDSCAW